MRNCTCGHDEDNHAGGAGQCRMCDCDYFDLVDDDDNEDDEDRDTDDDDD